MDLHGRGPFGELDAIGKRAAVRRNRVGHEGDAAAGTAHVGDDGPFGALRRLGVVPVLRLDGGVAARVYCINYGLRLTPTERFAASPPEELPLLSYMMFESYTKPSISRSIIFTVEPFNVAVLLCAVLFGENAFPFLSKYAL